MIRPLNFGGVVSIGTASCFRSELKPPSQLRQAVAAAVRQLQHISPQVGGFFGGFLVEFRPYDPGLRWMVWPSFWAGFVTEMPQKIMPGL